jgi:hypothetical protein
MELEFGALAVSRLRWPPDTFGVHHHRGLRLVGNEEQVMVIVGGVGGTQGIVGHRQTIAHLVSLWNGKVSVMFTNIVWNSFALRYVAFQRSDGSIAIGRLSSDAFSKGSPALAVCPALHGGHGL